ncbi:Maf family nucleotide pyrophosphatase [Emcibacter sp. SYSU 3D8]|uniref:Maf family nucleotide pyrophosphatase n=1 Tax=Emcibacter sp. SYSU 3D8 TaxID=3133969 RepID=UPI0031FF41C3
MNRLVLASGSRVRAALLRQAGLEFDTCAADVDEFVTKRQMAGADPMAVAEALAAIKAVAVSPAYPGAVVIGADQMLVCGDALFDKPANLDEARSHLRRLRGRTHHLCTATALVRDGEVLWRHSERPELVMRPFSDCFIETYLSAVGDDALLSVGAYQLEGRGAQLFERVSGDFFSILGLPLLPLLAFLRHRQLIEA